MIRAGSAPRDALTRLAPRDAFERVLRRLAAAGRGSTACLLVDVVGMKAANAAGGFSTGDALLREAAARLRAITPAARIRARLGGDELVALFSGRRARELAAEACRAAGAVETPRLRAGWVELAPGESPRALVDRLYARCREEGAGG